MKKMEKELFPLMLQFFADDNGGNDNNGDNGQNNNGNDQHQNDPPKTFTQDQVNAMMAKEKNEGKRSVLKSLGFKNEDEAKSAIALYNALLDTQKTDEQKQKEAIDKANSEKEEYRLKAEQAENKVLCLENGVDKNSIDDVLAIAHTKVTAQKSLSAVLSEMSKETKYATFFKASDNNGTGNDPKHNNGSGGSFTNYGKELAERAKNPSRNQENKSSYF